MLISFVYYFAVTIQEVESVWCCVVNVDDDIYDFLSTKFSIFKTDQFVLFLTRSCIPFQGHLVHLEWNTKWLFCSLRLRSMRRPTNNIHYAFILLEYQTVNVHNGRYMERYFMSLTKKEAERFNRRNRSIIRSLCGHHSEMLLFRPGNSWANIHRSWPTDSPLVCSWFVADRFHKRHIIRNRSVAPMNLICNDNLIYFVVWTKSTAKSCNSLTRNQHTH